MTRCHRFLPPPLPSIGPIHDDSNRNRLVFSTTVASLVHHVSRFFFPTPLLDTACNFPLRTVLCPFYPVSSPGFPFHFPAFSVSFSVPFCQAKVLALAPAAVVSRRCTKKARGIFLREINDGGLVLLNEVKANDSCLRYV